MSDPPPRKVGSLRDRIAAFENKGPAPTPSPPPPRPKPAGGAQWKPKSISPPSSPRSSADNNAERKSPASGMSASDAKESIGRGVSLKERMAALQGKGGFGGGVPALPVSPPPKPTAEKPKWKPPPAVVSPLPESQEHADSKDAHELASAASPPPTSEQHPSPPYEDDQEHGHAPEGSAEEEAQPDPEEEERRRRAAIAARMARLGGARVGMGGPPVFGRKPEVKKLSLPKEEEHPAESKPEAVSPTSGSPAVRESIQSESRKSTEAVPSPPITSAESPASAPARPPAMPVPAAPRRAAPPRKRTPKEPSPAPPQPIIDAEVTQSPAGTPDLGTEAGSHEFAEAVQKIKEIEAQLQGQVAEDRPSAEGTEHPPPPPPTVPREVHAPVEDHVDVSDVAPVSTEQPVHAQVVEQQLEPIEEPDQVTQEPEEEEEEEEEDARRQRIADRVAKMGGFNPFGGGAPPPPPPVRKPSLTPSQHAREDLVPTRRASTEVSPHSPPVPPPPARRLSVRKDSTDSTAAPPPSVPARRPSVRQGSVDSISSSRSPPPLPTSAKPEISGRRESTGSIGPGPARRLSLDDRKAIPVPVAIPEIVPQRRFTEEISEEPESEPEARRATATSGQAHEIGDQRGVHQVTTAGQEEEEVPRASQRFGYESPGEEEEEGEIEEDEEDEEDGNHTPGAHQWDDEPRARRVSFLRVEEEQVYHDESVDEAEETYVPPPEEFVPPPPPPPLTHLEKRASIPPPIPEKRTSIPYPHPERRTSVPSRVPPPPPLTQFVGIPPPPPIARSITPPPPLLQADEGQENDQDQYNIGVTPPLVGRVPPPPPVAPRPPPRAPPPPPMAITPQVEEELEDGEEADSPALSPLDSRDNVSYLDIHDATDLSPVLTPDPRPDYIYNEEDEDEDGDVEGEVEDEQEEREREVPLEFRRRSLPPPPRPPPAPPSQQFDDGEDEVSQYSEELVEEPEHEVLDEEDGDPIDPSFHSPAKSPHVALQPAPPSVPPPPPALVEVPPPPPIGPPPPVPQAALTNDARDEDDEKARRHTIAERMAKLGGLRFGAPPPVRRPQPPPPPPEPSSTEEGDEEQKVEAEEAPEEEEDEFARKQRIAARIAGMGGMRFGMFPSPVAPSPLAAGVPKGEESPTEVRPPLPPPRLVPPPPPPVLAPPTARDEEFEHVSGSPSDDGVHVEAEESEMEEVDLAQEPPPPIPTREGRRASLVPSIPQRVPPVPSAFVRPPVPTARSSIPGPSPVSRPPIALPSPIPESPPSSDGGAPPPSQHTYPPVTPITPIVQNDYVIVEATDVTEEPAPPPPPRPSRAPLPRAVPPPAPPAAAESTTAPKHKSMPSLSSSIDFGQEADLSFSSQFTQGSSNYQAPIFSPPPPPRRESLRKSSGRPTSNLAPILPPPPVAPPPSIAPSAPVTESQLTADDLMAHWGRVGIQIHDTAVNALEKSRKSLVGDGSFVGFVVSVVAQVQSATQPVPPFDSFGYLIYSQLGTSVQRRTSDIMPGDVIELFDAKFKGHKGLQSYHQSVGVGERLVAIVADFEVKKSKVKVFQANQHVGQQSVESASYRLEDMKSGSVKVYRVLAA